MGLVLWSGRRPHVCCVLGWVMCKWLGAGSVERIRQKAATLAGLGR